MIVGTNHRRPNVSVKDGSDLLLSHRAPYVTIPREDGITEGRACAKHEFEPPAVPMVSNLCRLTHDGLARRPIVAALGRR